MSADRRIRGYSHVNLVVTNLAVAREFYAEKFGFAEIPRPDFGDFVGAWFQVGNLQLHLGVVDEMPDLKGAFPHVAFHIPADQFDETIESLKLAGVPFLSDPASREDFGVPVRAAFCADPDGNIIELTDVGPA